MDVFIPQVDDYVTIVEIKGTNWDRIKQANVTRNLGSHRRQVWKYIKEYTDRESVDVCAGIIYPKPPPSIGLRKRVETYMGEYGIAVVWYDE